MRNKTRGFLALFAVSLLIISIPDSGKAQSERLGTEDLARRAEVIIVGKVTAVRSEWNADRSRINTTVTVSIDQKIKGEESQSSISISTPGGEVDGIGEWYSHTPKFKIDEEVVVFAEKDQKEKLRISGGDQGKLTVKKDVSSGNKTVIDSEPLLMYTAHLKSIVQAQSHE